MTALLTEDERLILHVLLADLRQEADDARHRAEVHHCAGRDGKFQLATAEVLRATAQAEAIAKILHV